MLQLIKSPTALKYLCLAFFIFLLIPPHFYDIPHTGLDESWHISIHLALKYHLVFGKDFAFTYGPLGILHTRLPISVSLFTYLLIDLYFLASLFFLLKEVFRKRFGIGIVLFILADIYICANSVIEDRYFFLFLFYTFSWLKNPEKNAFFIQSVLLCLIGFYLKVSTGLPEIVIFCATLLYMVIWKKTHWKKSILLLVSFLIALWLSAVLLRVQILPYLKIGWQLIDNYNDAMFIPHPESSLKLTYAAVLIIALIAAFILYRLLDVSSKKAFLASTDEFYIYGILALAVFVLFKHGFVRGDSAIHLFFLGIGLYIALFYHFSPERAGIPAACLCWVTLLIALWGKNEIYPNEAHSYAGMLPFSFMAGKTKNVNDYFHEISSYNHDKAIADSLDTKDNPLKKIIGTHTVDVVPFDISKVYFNGLRYNPRPLVQSYAAFSAYLDSLNYEKYLSADAPDYVLFSLYSIDQRYPFFDESRTKLALLSHYDFVGQLDGDIILKKKSGPAALPQPERWSTTTAKIGEEIPIKKDSALQFSRIKISYSKWGKLKRFFYQPPELTIYFTLDNGMTKSYRAIKPLLDGGVIINKFAEETDDFQLLMQTGGTLSTGIRSIRIDSAGKHSGLADNIQIETVYYSFHEKKTPANGPNALTLAAFLDKYKPIPIDTTMLKPAAIHKAIVRFDTYGAFPRLEGWAYLENSEQEQREVILQSRKGTYAIPTITETIPGLSATLHQDSVDNAGFMGKVSKGLLEPGDYQPGIVIRKKDDPQGSLLLLDGLHMLVKSKYRLQKDNKPSISPVNDGPVHCAFSPARIEQDHLVLEGWVYKENLDSRNATVHVTIQGKNAAYHINADIIKRSDLSAYFHNPLYEYAGFYTEVPIDSLPKGDYQLGTQVDYPGSPTSVKFSDHATVQ